MNRRMFRLFILAPLLCYLPVSAEAGLWTWLFGPSAMERYQVDTGANITAYARSSIIAELKKKAGVEHKPAIQVGEIHSSISQETADNHWFGSVKVRVKANYSATYGMPYDLIEKGMRIEKSTTGLVVIVSAPVPLSVSVDTRSVYLESREKTGMRTWSKSSELQLDAQKWLKELATSDAQQRCRDTDALEMTKAVVLDLVLDMAGELYSKEMKRVLAPNTVVIFEHERVLNDLRGLRIPLTPFEIDARKSNSVRVRSDG